jgi:hypothetical protein
VNRFALALVLVTLNTFCRVGFRIEWYRVDCAEKLQSTEQRKTQKKQDFQEKILLRGTRDYCNLQMRIPNLVFELGEGAHVFLRKVLLHDGRRFERERKNSQQLLKSLYQNVSATERGCDNSVSFKREDRG